MPFHSLHTTAVSVGFGESQYSALESDGLVAVDIRFFGSTDIPLNFLLSTSDDSAVSGEDYEGVTMLPVSVPAQTTMMTVNVRLVNDDRVEDEREQFQISLRGGDNLPAARVNLNQTTTTVTVMDDDGELAIPTVFLVFVVELSVCPYTFVYM